MGVFKFKQFEVDQTGCAMKINTDGVLIAALANHSAPKKILDIGTGTGVIALMLAQRFPNALVDAVEIDAQAAETAGKNFKNSIFIDRLSINHIAIEQYNTSQKFDLIVSNPPFFVNDLKSEGVRKGIARHADEHFFDALIAKVVTILSEDGSFWFVLPVKQAELLVEEAKPFNLVLNKLIHLHSNERKPEFRRIVCLSKTNEKPVVEHLYLYESEKVYTQSYKALLKDFFLGY
ncbi:MAG: methyltransferase domain-containing protein [Pedobacter sp.]|jgi:tRNA1Val (adenine37-N6)-methyltransferase|nr:MAG: methyltransferase domain-containing protein [Pedobacter sp.]